MKEEEEEEDEAHAILSSCFVLWVFDKNQPFGPTSTPFKDLISYILFYLIIPIPKSAFLDYLYRQTFHLPPS